MRRRPFLHAPLLRAILAGSVMMMSSPAAQAQDDAPAATIHLGDGTSVALVSWKLSYEFATWKAKEPVSSAKAQVRETPGLVIGRKSIPVKGDVLTLTHLEGNDTVRVTGFSLKKAGDFKSEAPARDTLAPELEKSMFFQSRSLDISGKTLSGIERSFCVASFWPLVECGVSKSSRVVRIEFN